MCLAGGSGPFKAVWVPDIPVDAKLPIWPWGYSRKVEMLKALPEDQPADHG